MDRELEQQIDELIQKSTKDLKARICRAVTKSFNKALKDQAKELKNGAGASSTTGSSTAKRGRKVEQTGKSTTTGSSSSSKGRGQAKNDSYDSDEYYSD